jgi:hypothetical protein
MAKKAKVKLGKRPECEKMRRVIDSGHNTQISSFLETLQALGCALGVAEEMLLCQVNIADLLRTLTSDGEWEDPIIDKFWGWLMDEYMNSGHERVFDIRIESTLNKYFGIDEDKLEAERREALAGLRAGHALEKERESLGLPS